MQENDKKSTSERLSEILSQLSKDQLRFVVASMDYPSKKEAALAIGMKANTIYKWPAIVDEAIELMARDASESAIAMRRRALVKAMAVKLAGLECDDDALRQKTATEIIEWELGKAQQKTDVTTGGESINPYMTADAVELLELVRRIANAGNPKDA